MAPLTRAVERIGFATLVGMMMGCADRPDLFVSHFDPPTGTIISDTEPHVTVIELDNETLICFTTDGDQVEWDEGNCANKLTNSRTIPLACGFNVVKIAWADGEKTESANYQVENPECEHETGPVILWANDELVRATIAIKGEMECRMNGCQNPNGTGDWHADCDSGRVT